MTDCYETGCYETDCYETDCYECRRANHKQVIERRTVKVSLSCLHSHACIAFSCLHCTVMVAL